MRKSVFCLGALLAVALLLSLGHSGVCQNKSADQAYVDAVLDGLVRSGVITMQQSEKIKEDAEVAADDATAEAKPAKPKWYDNMKVSGYGQTRFLWYPDAEAGAPDNEFMVRRARIKVAATPTDRAKIQIQADFGDGATTVKDAWLQYDVSESGEWWVRAGQQKIPFGFETPQSSSVRLPLERNWVARRVIAGERDTGAVLFWTDPDDKVLLDHAKKNHFGTGDYGTIAIGVYNGQGINAAEVNDHKHISLRGTKPFMIGDRYAEAGGSYYRGSFHSEKAAMRFDEHLYGAHFYLPPDPVGIQGEYYNGETEGGDVDGFYAMGLWRTCEDGVAFVRYDEYNGPRKGKGLGNRYDRERWSFGYAYQLDKKTELTIEYDSERLLGGGHNDLFGVQFQMGY